MDHIGADDGADDIFILNNPDYRRGC